MRTLSTFYSCELTQSHRDSGGNEIPSIPEFSRSKSLEERTHRRLAPRCEYSDCHTFEFVLEAERQNAFDYVAREVDLDPVEQGSNRKLEFGTEA